MDWIDKKLENIQKDSSQCN